MNQLPRFPRPTQSRPTSVPRLASIIAIALGITTLSACSSVSDLTKERVTSSSVSVSQSEETLGRSEEGMVELQRAKENLAAAQKAVAQTDDEAAQRFASKAELHAQLAVAQSQSAAARRGAEEVLASTNALRKEAERPQATPTTP